MNTAVQVRLRYYAITEAAAERYPPIGEQSQRSRLFKYNQTVFGSVITDIREQKLGFRAVHLDAAIEVMHWNSRVTKAISGKPDYEDHCAAGAAARQKPFAGRRPTVYSIRKEKWQDRDKIPEQRKLHLQ